MSYYRECPNCGAHLDPGEACDCEKKATPKPKKPPQPVKRAAAKEAQSDANRH